MAIYINNCKLLSSIDPAIPCYSSCISVIGGCPWVSRLTFPLQHLCTYKCLRRLIIASHYCTWLKLMNHGSNLYTPSTTLATKHGTSLAITAGSHVKTDLMNWQSQSWTIALHKIGNSLFSHPPWRWFKFGIQNAMNESGAIFSPSSISLSAKNVTEMHRVFQSVFEYWYYWAIVHQH